MEQMSDELTIRQYAVLIRESEQAVRVGALKTLQRDLKEWVRGMSAAEQQIIEDALRARLGVELSHENAKDERVVERVLERGAIETDVEYRLLHQWVDRALEDGNPREQIEKADALLTAFGTQMR